MTGPNPGPLRRPAFDPAPGPPGNPAWVEVDLGALVHNGRLLRAAIPARTKLGIVVKANGYGHGISMAARVACLAGADWLVVATVSEGLALRDDGIDLPVLVIYPSSTALLVEAVNAGLDVTVSGESSMSNLRAALRALGSPNAPVGVHVEVDTGLGRGGFRPGQLADIIGAIEGLNGARIAGVWSHLADGANVAGSADQVSRFEEAFRSVAIGTNEYLRHMAATDGLLRDTCPVYDAVRIGLGYYGETGMAPLADGHLPALQLRPAFCVKARPINIRLLPPGATVGYGGLWQATRETLVATLQVGYADGWARSPDRPSEVLVNGRRAPIIGRASMDSVCVDVTDVGAIDFDDQFVLLGAQGTDRITLNELAMAWNTIPNNVLTVLGQRLPRIYHNGDT